MGVTECVNVSRVCASLCVYDTQTIAMCNAYRCMGFFVRYALHVHKGHVSSCFTMLFTYSFSNIADTT